MANTLITKNSSTAAAIPTAGQLVQGELAVNVTDKRVFTENAAGTVVELGVNPSSLTLASGTANGVAYLNGSKVLTSGSALTFDGTTLLNTAADPSSTTELLKLSRDNSGTFIKLTRNAASGNSGGLIGSDSVGTYYAGASTANMLYVDGVNGNLQFYANSAEQMRLTSTGLGIGTSSPDAKIVVEAGAVSQAAQTNDIAVFKNNANGYIKLYGPNTSTGGIAFGDSDDPYVGALTYSHSSDAMTMYVNNSERMRIDSSGNVGIGTSSPTNKLHVVGTAKIEGSTLDLNDAGTFTISQNTTASALILRTATSSYLRFDTNGANERVRITSDGNVGIGTSSPSSKLEIYDATSAVARVTAGTEIFEIRNTGSEVRLAVISADPLTFRTSNVEAMRIDSSGKLLVGTTSSIDSNAGISFLAAGAGVYTLASKVNSTASSAQIVFWNPNGPVGSVNTNGTATSFVTSSDYRLKEDWVAVANASTRVNALKPINFAWKVDGSRVDGFLAHELAEVVPEAVTGVKDAVDAEGKPVYQGIDQSKLVPLLTAALQEALAKIESLTARISALEGN